MDDAKALTNPARPSLIASTIICLIALIGDFLVGLFYHEYIGWMLGGRIHVDLTLGFRSRSTGYAHLTIVALIIVTIVLVLAFGYGGVQAMDQLSEEGQNYVLKTKEGSRCIKLLRVGSEIILVQESDGHVSVVPDSEVGLLRRTGDPLRNPRISTAQLRAWL